MYILGIESSCDDTSAAVLNDNILLSNVPPRKPYIMSMAAWCLSLLRVPTSRTSCP